jgi:hypothetical protein
MAKYFFSIWTIILLGVLSLGTALADSNDTNLVYFNDSLNITLPQNATINTTLELGETTTAFILNMFLLAISIIWLICAFATSSFAMGLGAGTFGILTGMIWLTSKDFTMRNAMAITLILVSLLALWNIVSDMRKRKN